MKKRSDLHAGRALLRAGLQSHVFMAELLEFQSKLRGGECDCICTSPAALDFKNLEVDMWWHAPDIAWPLRKDDPMPLHKWLKGETKKSCPAAARFSC